MDITHYRGKPVLDNGGNRLGRKPCKNIHRQFQTCLAQGNALHHISHCQAGSAQACKKPGAFQHAMTVGIRLDQGNHASLTRLLAAELKIMGQGPAADADAF